MLDAIAKLCVLTFVAGSMATIGLSLTIQQITAPLRRVRLVLLTLLANFVAAPALAYALTKAIPLRESHAVGLLLLGGAAGAPFLPKLVELAGGSLARAVALTNLLMVASAVFMPLALPLMIPGMRADFWSLIRPLLVQMLLPLSAGLVLNRFRPALAARLKPGLRLVTNLTVILAVTLLFGLNLQSLIGTIGSGAVAVAAAYVGLACTIGYYLGDDADSRSVLTLATGQRNIPAALVTAGTCYPADPEVVVMILVATFVGLAVLLIAARRLRPPTMNKSVDDPATG